MQSQESMFFHGYITVKKVLSAHLACLAAVVNLAKKQVERSVDRSLFSVSSSAADLWCAQTLQCGGCSTWTEGEEECSGCEEQLRPDGGDCGRTRAGSSAPPLLHQTHGRDCTEKSCANYTQTGQGLGGGGRAI